jgi:AcrR family transcriptional regulator
VRRRSDFGRNREAIIAAFTELLASDGADVPLYRVARRAGVGQATLYRHFPERGLLAMAVYDHRLQHLTELGAARADDPSAFVELMQELIVEETRTPGLLRLLRGAAEGERYYRGLRQRALELLAAPLERAKTAGVVRADVQLDDVGIIFAMMAGAVQEADTTRRPQVARRALELLFAGVVEQRPPARRHSPPGRPI